MPDTQVYTVEINAPIRRVWDEITKVGPVQRHMFDCVMPADMKPGGKYRWETPGGKHVIIKGEIVEVTPPTRFVHTFRWVELTEETSRVTWVLEEQAGRTRVTVTHDRLAAAPKTAKRVAGGWGMILKNLKAVVENGNLPVPMRLMFGIMKVVNAFKRRTPDALR